MDDAVNNGAMNDDFTKDDVINDDVIMNDDVNNDDVIIRGKIFLFNDVLNYSAALLKFLQCSCTHFKIKYRLYMSSLHVYGSRL